TDLGDEGGVLRFAPKIVRAAQGQMVFYPALQVRVAGLHVAVLIGLPDVDGARGDPEMIAEGLVGLVEGALGALAADLMGGAGTVVGLQMLRHAAEFEDRLLYP